MSDLISREEVLDEINNIGSGAFASYSYYSNLFDFVCELPSVEPERKKGEWIEGEKTPGYIKWSCSECGMLCRNSQKPWYKFCPNCGAKMEEVQDGNTD